MLGTKNTRRCSSRVLRFALLLLLPASLATPAPAQEGTASGEDQRLALPSVPDEASTITPTVLRGKSSGSAVADSFQSRMDHYSELAQAREEMRRAFIQQDYERVLALSQEIRTRYSEEEGSNFFVVAAQLRLTERKELKEGVRSYRRLSDRAPELSASLPSVEPSAEQESAERVVASVPTRESGMPAESGTAVAIETATAPGSLLPAETTAETGAAAGQGGPDAGVAPLESARAAIPGERTEGEKDLESARSAPGEFEVAMAVTPVPGRGQGAGSGATSAIPVESAPRTAFIERIFLVLILVALAALGLLLVFVMRRREEPEENLASTLGGVMLEQPAAGPAAAADQRTGSAVVEEEEPAETKVFTAPIDSYAADEVERMFDERPAGDAGAAGSAIAPDQPEFDESLFDEIIEENAFSEEDSRTVAAAAAAAVAEEAREKAKLKAKEQTEHPADLDIGEVQFAGLMSLDQEEKQAETPETAATLGAGSGVAGADPFAEPSHALPEDASINLNDLPETNLDTDNWRATEEPISLDLGSSPGVESPVEASRGMMEVEETSSAPADDSDLLMVEPSFPRDLGSPESDETIGGFSPESAPPMSQSPAPSETDSLTGAMGASSAGPLEKTRTSWEDGETPDGAMQAEVVEDADNENLPSAGLGDDLRLKSFHADETVDLRPEEDEDQTLESRQPGFGIGDEDTVSDVSVLDELDEQTIVSPEIQPVPTPEPPAEEDLFDRERRKGMESFESQNWAAAVHHLSVAAALRPEKMDVKEKLREARRYRSQQQGANN
jgi:hypothetical protein